VALHSAWRICYGKTVWALRGGAHLGADGQQRAEVVLQEVLHLANVRCYKKSVREVLHLSVQRRAVLQQLLQLVDRELARGAPAAIASCKLRCDGSRRLQEAISNGFPINCKKLPIKFTRGERQAGGALDGVAAGP
jgi:hypothetical protein